MVKSSSSSKTGPGRKDAPVTSLEEIPRYYGETRIVILPRDPYWIFAYWEITEDVRSQNIKKYGKNLIDKAQLALRVYDITDVNFDGKNANKYFDVNVTPFADSWYINMPEVNRDWCIDLGMILPDGRFITLARSNIVKMPRYGVSPLNDEQWGTLQKEFERLLRLSGVEHIGKGSFDIARLMRERWEEIVSISSMRSSPLGISSFRKMPEAAIPAKKKDFWLKADTELIVYGTTESDAKLTVDGQQVKLNPDGSFHLRFNLPDGVMNIPIEASSADNTMSKKIKFTVTRKKEI